MAVFDALKEQAKVQNTWEKWASYRESLTQFLCHQIEDAKRVVIVGAGACDDIDLCRICENREKVVLIDNDSAALSTIPDNTDLERRVKKLVLGIDGTEDFMYREFCENLVRFIRQSNLPEMKQSVVSAFDAYALRLLEEYEKIAKKNRQTLADRLPEADVYICIGLCSQLQTMFAYPYHALRGLLFQILEDGGKNLHEKKEWKAEEEPEGIFFVEAFLKQRNRNAIELLHDVLLQKTKQKCIFGNEYMRSSKCDTITVTKREEERILRDGEPIEGAYQAFRDIRSRNLKCLEYTTYWPFDVENGVGYEMLLQVVEQ